VPNDRSGAPATLPTPGGRRSRRGSGAQPNSRPVSHDLVRILHQLTRVEAHAEDRVGPLGHRVLLETVHGLVARCRSELGQRGDLAADELLATRARRAHDAARPDRDAPAGAEHLFDLGARWRVEGRQDRNLVTRHLAHGKARLAHIETMQSENVPSMPSGRSSIDILE